MKLAGETITVILTEDGRQLLKLAEANLPDTHKVTVVVQESEDLGLWIRIERTERMHYFLIRWECILAIDRPDDSGSLVGLRSRELR